MDTNNEIRRGRPSKFTTEQIAKALDLVNNGATLAAAAEATGMTVQNVMYHRRKANGESGTRARVVSADPLVSQETGLISKYDGEISRLESTIEKAQTRLKETITKRRRVAKALGLITDVTPEEAAAALVVPTE